MNGPRPRPITEMREEYTPTRVQLPSYDGKGKWETFIRQFETITRRWSDDRKLSHFLSNLKGEAAEFAFDLEPEVVNHYPLLLEEMEKRFITRETRQSKLRAFFNRRYTPRETLSEYAADLKSLFRKAYPDGLTHYAREEMLLKQFFDGQHDDDIRFYVEYIKAPRNIDDAVEMENEYLGYRNHLQQKELVAPHPPMRETPHESQRINQVQRTVATSPTPRTPTVTTPAPGNELVELIKKIHDALTRLAPPPAPNPALLCYHCKERGHIRRDCPHQKPTTPSNHSFKCHRCGEIGHFRQNYPHRQPTTSSN